MTRISRCLQHKIHGLVLSATAILSPSRSFIRSFFPILAFYVYCLSRGSQKPKILHIWHISCGCGYTINVNDTKTGQIDSYRFVSGVILSNQEVDANKSPRIIIEFEKEEVVVIVESKKNEKNMKKW